MDNVFNEGDEGFVADLNLAGLNFAALDVADGHIVDLINTLYEDFVTAKADGKFDYQEIYGLFGVLVQIGKHAIEVFESPSDHVNAIVADLEKLFDLYVAPLDLPIPDLLEGWADRQLRAQIRPNVELLLDYISR